MRYCKATDDGLSIVSAGQETREADMTPFDWDKVHAFPVSEFPTVGACLLTDFISDGMEEQRDRETPPADSRLQCPVPAH